MKIDYEKKDLICDCGHIEDMEDVVIQKCFHCDDSYYLPQCDCDIEFVKIPSVLFDYIDSYKSKCANKFYSNA